eukprot:880529-Prorocentrum_lima.AAC.1
MKRLGVTGVPFHASIKRLGASLTSSPKYGAGGKPASLRRLHSKSATTKLPCLPLLQYVAKLKATADVL